MILMDPGWGEQGRGPSVGQLWDLLAARTSSLWSLYVMTGSDRFLQQSERKLSSAGHCDPLVTHLEPMGKLAHPSVPPGPSGLSPCSQYHWNSSPHGTGGSATPIFIIPLPKAFVTLPFSTARCGYLAARFTFHLD